MTSSVSKPSAMRVGSLARHQFGTSQALHKRLQPHGVRVGKQRSSRLNVIALKELSLPVVLDRDFDKEGSRVYKRTVLCSLALQKLLDTLGIKRRADLLAGF